MRAPYALLSLATVLYAQDNPDRFRFVPADATFVLRASGPAVWRRQLGTTGLGRALSAKATVESFQRLVEAVQEEIDPDGEHTRQVVGFTKLLGDYGGELVIAGRLDVASVTSKKMPEFAVSVTLTPDGQSDLDGIRQQIEEQLPEAGEERQLAGHSVRVHHTGMFEWTSPFLCEGTLVMLGATSLDDAGLLFLGPREQKFAPTPNLVSGVCGVQIDFGDAIRAVAGAFENADRVEVRTMGKVFELVGMKSLQRVTWSIFPDQGHVGQEARIEWTDDERGLFDVVFPVRHDNPKLLAYLPPQAQNWNTVMIDMAAAQKLYGKIFERFGADIPMSREKLESLFTQYTKLRLQEDVLAMIGGEYLRINDFAAMADEKEVDPRLAKVDEKVGDTCYVVQLLDGKTMAKNFETALRARGLHVGRKSEDYGDAKIYRMSVLGSMPIEYAFAGDLFVLGIGAGEGTARNLRGVLDMVAARAKGAAANELSPELQERLRGWPADWCTIDVGTMSEVLDGFTGAIDTLEPMLEAEGLEPEDLGIWHHVAEFAHQLRPALVRQGADVTVTTGYSSRDAYTMRSRW